MPVTYFRIPLSVQPTTGGEAKLVPPKVLQDVGYSFVIVKEGGREGIIKLEGLQAVQEQVEKAKDCQKLTPKQMEELRKSYPKPKLKQEYRAITQSLEAGRAAGLHVVDEKGNKVIDTIQTVRSGFYLIDVPVVV